MVFDFLGYYFVGLEMFRYFWQSRFGCGLLSSHPPPLAPVKCLGGKLRVAPSTSDAGTTFTRVHWTNVPREGAGRWSG